jgi:hypothetical protein
VTLALGQSRYDPADPIGKMFFNILATFAEPPVAVTIFRSIPLPV